MTWEQKKIGTHSTVGRIPLLKILSLHRLEDKELKRDLSVRLFVG